MVQNIEVHDTLREVTTITVDRNDRGDTLRQCIVTDRYRGRDAQQLKAESEKLVVRTDTVYIEKRDSISNTNFTNPTNKKSNFVTALKWIFTIVCAIIVLIIVIKLGMRRSLF